jgi:hypothetical protein
MKDYERITQPVSTVNASKGQIEERTHYVEQLDR